MSGLVGEPSARRRESKWNTKSKDKEKEKLNKRNTKFKDKEKEKLKTWNIETKNEEYPTSLFMCTLGGDMKPNSWYLIKPFEEEFVSPKPSCAKFLDSAGACGWVTSGSKIYSFGGGVRAEFPFGGRVRGPFEGKNQIWICDTSKEKVAWTQHYRAMKQPRFDPVPIAFDSTKICVFGSNMFVAVANIPKPWAEVFYTDTGKCKAIAEPPPEFIELGMVEGFIVHKDRILLHAGGVIFAYYVEADTWKNVTDEYRFLPDLWSESAILDDVVYTYNLLRVVAYDLTTNCLSEVKGSDKFIFCAGARRGHVFRWGKGSLCLVVYKSDATGLDSVDIQCCVFDVFKTKSEEENKSGFGSKIISYRSFKLQGTYVDCCIAL